MSQLSHLYLPELAGNADNVGEPEHAGAWKNNERKILRGISKGIAVSERAKDVRGVSSVPDIWARPLMFQTAIRPESGHPLREQMVQEWRGLLSLLALRQVLGDKVEIVPVRLGQRNFSEALRNLKPADVQLEAGQTYRWTDVLMIRYDDIPIGAFSPTTLVYTAVDYQDALRDRPLDLQQRDADGRKTGLLAPPTHPEKKEYVGEWVYELYQRLGPLLNQNGTSQHSPSVSAVLNGLFANWLAEIRQDLGIGKGKEIDATDVKVADDHTRPPEPWAPLKEYRIYQELLRPLVLDQEARSEGGNSDLALDPPRNTSGYEEVVVLTPEVMEQDVRIWKIKRIDELGGDAHAALARDAFDQPQGDRIDDADLSKLEACWIRPERYFLTDVLVKAPGNEPLLPDGERALNEGGRFLLPFKKEILDFFSPRQIQEQLAPAFEDTGSGVKFTFSLPLVDGRTADVEKTYRFKNATSGEGSITEQAMPVLELFPDYLGENWRRYYLFQGDVDDVTAAPVLRGDGAATAREHEGQVDGKRRTVRTTEMRGDDAFPEGIAFTESGAGGAACGLLLVEKPVGRQNRLTGPNHWRVGVDFGTSNTTIFRRSDGTAQKWEFMFSKYFRPLTASADRAGGDLLEHYFLPDANIELPVPTFLRELGETKDKRLLLDYFAHFSSSYKLPGYVETNVKWEGDPNLIGHFVESLLFLVLLETTHADVKELKLACSYPEAFSGNIKGMFQQAWTDKLGSLTSGAERALSIYQGPDDQNEKLLITSNGAITANDLAFEKEGYAAGEFFGSPKTVPHAADEADKQGAAILDVGGGTTDISIWYDGRIVHSSSLLLAGRQIAGYLKNNPQLRGLLFSQDAAVALQEGTQESGARFASRLNSVLRDQGDDVQRLVAKHGTRDEVERLRQIIAFEFGALAYYTAALVGAVEQTPAGAGILDWVSDEANEFKLHWGGNAAKLLSWVDHGGSYRPDGVAAKVLTAMTFNALRGLDGVDISADRIGQVMSPDHKSEAAGGLSVMQLGKYQRHPAAASTGDGAGSSDEMVFDEPSASSGDAHDSDASPSDGSEDDAPSPEAEGVVCGEAIQLASGPAGFTDFISNRLLFENGRTTYESTDLEQFGRFVKMLNHFGTNFGLFSESMKIELTDSNKRVIARKVRTAFKEARSLPDKERVIEPVFIMEAKALLELIGSGR